MGWKRTSRTFICPRCSRAGYCTIVPDGTAVKCMWDTSGKPVTDKNGTVGYLHPLTGEQSTFIRAQKSAADAPARTKTEWELIFRRYRSAITPQLVSRTADELGVTEKSLDDLEVCRDVGCEHWKGTNDPCFPMRDATRKVIGFRIRHPDAYVKAHNARRYTGVIGSNSGLFIPASFEPQSLQDAPARGDNMQVLLLPEGPTDVAAARSLGFMAIGRPSNNGGGILINALLRNSLPVETIIVADRDEVHYLRDGTPFWPGWEGALTLASQLVDVHGTRRVLSLKKAGAKDIREWLVVGGRPQVFEDILSHAEWVDAKWLKSNRAILDAMKKRLMRKTG